MSRQKRGLQYEHDLANAIENNTSDKTRVVRAGFSGNSAIPQPDLLILTEDRTYAAEVKNTAQDRFYITLDDLKQLWDFCNDYITPVIIVKFSYREPVVIDLSPKLVLETGDFLGVSSDATVQELVCHAVDVTPDAFKPHMTNGWSLRLDKPDTESWTSSQAGRADHEVVIRKLRL